jgi:hypothetical protein
LLETCYKKIKQNEGSSRVKRILELTENTFNGFGQALLQLMEETSSEPFSGMLLQIQMKDDQEIIMIGMV